METEAQTYSGYGIAEMIKTSNSCNLTNYNSKLYIDNPNNMGSHWTIIKVVPANRI